jgi:hypothetical protein
MSDDRILEAAKDFMRAYMGDGRVRQPGAFDEEIMGRPSTVDLAMMRLPAWNASIFCKALGELARTGEVRAWQGDDGQWFYQMPGVPVS